jgi:hypothetical protein
VIVGNVPTERLSDCKQELGIGRHRDETRRIGVEDGPDDPEVLGQVWAQEFALSLSCRLKGLHNDRDENSHEYNSHY